MKRSNILLWASLLPALVSCKHQPEEPEIQNLTFVLSQTSCYSGDTLRAVVFADGKRYSGKVQWTWPEVYRSGDEYSLIVPSFQSDSATDELAVIAGSQMAVQTIRMINRVFKYPMVSYEHTIQPLLNNNCNFSGCHANGSRAGKVELSCYDSTMMSVYAYDANVSLLYIALIKTDPLRVMPPAGKLHDYKIEDVRRWIEQGAKNN